MARKRVTRKRSKAAKPARNKFANMSLSELLVQQQAIEAAISEARQRERADVLIRMEQLASKSGFSLNELVGGRGKGKGKGTVGVAKYANPDNRAETWTGRGRKPNWLIAKLKKGSKLNDFTI